MRRRAERLASLVGRDPAIERAKDLLCERYMISRREAFVLLRQTSQRTNRKLRLVAHQICEMYDAPEDSRRATP
jgi:AmiR/NasT family two-component response regulator